MLVSMRHLEMQKHFLWVWQIAVADCPDLGWENGPGRKVIKSFPYGIFPVSIGILELLYVTWSKQPC